ncbi:hypothetical protein Syun_025654 [Stephania yunnanensis]|uniref:Uncharacterized protein n=1 Tax=Stephania yunnanensis TaxID=152371 RepID=A0AAP0HVD1_9MAGN
MGKYMEWSVVKAFKNYRQIHGIECSASSIPPINFIFHPFFYAVILPHPV